jgi:hypothetical protein
MPPRECDNDDCDYEQEVGDDGVPRNVWVHVDGCKGLDLPEFDSGSAPDGSFEAYLQGRHG